MLNYSIVLNKGWTHYSLLFAPVTERNLINMITANVERLGICDACDFDSRAHVIWWKDEPDRGHKLCPIIFHDAIGPTWKLEDVN